MANSKKSSSSKTVKKAVKYAKKNPKKAIVFVIVIIIIALLGFAGFYCYNLYKAAHNTYFTLNGNEKVNVALNSNYKELGATAYYKNEDISDEILISYYESDESTSVEKISTDEVKQFCVKYTIDHEELKAELHRHVYVIDTEDISINFLELGNYHTGDCTYIKAGDVDILIDAGSKQSSSETIANFLNQPGRVEDNKLEYVIVTHAHEDHYSGFYSTKSNPGIFERYEVGTIIEFGQSGNVGKSMYNSYAEARDAEIEAGATWYSANQLFGTDKKHEPVFDIAAGIQMEVLYQKFYDEVSGDENNHSVCCMFTQGDNHYLFTGDLEKEGEESLVASNSLPEVKLFKGGHHGSKTSNNDCLLSVIKPKVVCICCCAGNDEYTSNVDNQFPTQAAIDRISAYTDKVYVTTVTTDGHQGYESMNGNITFTSNGNDYQVNGSNNSVILKETDWFKNNRVTPSSW